MLDMILIIKPLATLWLKSLLDDKSFQWKTMPLHYLEKAGG